MDSSCTKCDIGRYSDLEGLVTSENACVACESGKYSQIEGADKESLCLFCGPGRYCTETAASSVRDLFLSFFFFSFFSNRSSFLFLYFYLGKCL